MNLQQLESFIQVAENLSFARAAEVLNMTQSAVSRQISSLETNWEPVCFTVPPGRSPLRLRESAFWTMRRMW